MATKITREVIEGYLECRYKGRLRLAGESGERSEYQGMIADEEMQIRTLAVAQLCARYSEGEARMSARLAAADLGKGSSLVLDAVIEDERTSLRFDGLIRVAGQSRLGDFHYVPVLYQAGLNIRRQTRHLLGVMGLLLGAVQGRQPAAGLIIRGVESRRAKVNLTTKLTRLAGEVLEELKRMQAGDNGPSLMLNDHCQECEFRRRCYAEAKAKDDLSLLRGMTETELRTFRNKGIFTVAQLSYTFRPRRKSKRTRSDGQPHHAALQALALRDKKTYVLGNPAVPDRPVRVYVDLEGDANTNGIYLVGALVVKAGVETSFSFWADQTSEERRLFQELLGVIQGNDFVLLHFGNYERRFFKRMRRHARRKGPVDRLLTNAVDVLSLIRSNVYFPVYANGLKEIGQHLGFAWTDPDACGLQSLVWRRRWEQTRDDSFKQRLLTYNAEDCAALRLLTEHLETITSTFGREDNGTVADGPRSIEWVNAGKRGDNFYKWGHTIFLLPEFERASRCAWFDYQREKVVAHKGMRKKTRTAGCKKARQPRPTKRVAVRSRRCPQCKSPNIYEARSARRTKVLLDLNVSESGVRRIVSKYSAAKHRCRDCGRYFLPTKFKKLPRFGHALKCWTLYQHIANRTSFESLERTLKECFALVVPSSDIHRFKMEMARRYKGTYANILQKIVAGHLLNADETGVRFKQDKGYVFAFANLENVVFLCRSTRETDFLIPMLDGFSGVLVSDFYAGYDAMPCRQQKCLVHLIRDLNGDLQARFHDEELKGLAKAFGAVLTKVIATVDRYGLRRDSLQRHREDVQGFFEQACEKAYQSELAEKYRRRFLKYRAKLFAFIDHDGVPWHNNNAEHAIKHFAKYRMIVNGRVTANGLQPYLVLLSIYQTCVYKKTNFLRFLLSRERDVDTFVTRTKQRGCRRQKQDSAAEREPRDGLSSPSPKPGAADQHDPSATPPCR